MQESELEEMKARVQEITTPQDKAAILQELLRKEKECLNRMLPEQLQQQNMGSLKDTIARNYKEQTKLLDDEVIAKHNEQALAKAHERGLEIEL